MLFMVKAKRAENDWTKSVNEESSISIDHNNIMPTNFFLMLQINVFHLTYWFSVSGFQFISALHFKVIFITNFKVSFSNAKNEKKTKKFFILNHRKSLHLKMSLVVNIVPNYHYNMFFCKRFEHMVCWCVHFHLVY